MDVENIGVFEARTRFYELLDKVKSGYVYRITRRGKPIAELRPVSSSLGRPIFGADRGRIVRRDDFEVPLDDMKTKR